MNILVRMPNWVGDIVMATPAARFLARAFPDAQLHAMVRPNLRGLLHDESGFHAVHYADERESRPAGELRAVEFDAAVLMPNSFRSALYAWRLRARHRVGYARAGRSFLLTRRVKYDPYEWFTPCAQPRGRLALPRPTKPLPRQWPRHTVHFYLRLAEETISALGRNPATVLADFRPALHVPPAADALLKVNELYAEAGFTPGRPRIGFNVGAAFGTAKQWPLERYAECARIVFARTRTPIICTSYRGERAQAETFESLCARQSVPVVRLGERVDLAGMVALLQSLQLLVTNDSGGMHLAAAGGVPVVAPFGPTDWNTTHPFGVACTIVRKSPPCAPCFLRDCPIDHPCMNSIEPAEVAEAALRQLPTMIV